MAPSWSKYSRLGGSHRYHYSSATDSVSKYGLGSRLGGSHRHHYSSATDAVGKYLKGTGDGAAASDAATVAAIDREDCKEKARLREGETLKDEREEERTEEHAAREKRLLERQEKQSEKGLAREETKLKSFESRQRNWIHKQNRQWSAASDTSGIDSADSTTLRNVLRTLHSRIHINRHRRRTKTSPERVSFDLPKVRHDW